MSDRRALVLFVLIMAACSIAVGSVAIGFFYQEQLRVYRRDLIGVAREVAAALAREAEGQNPAAGPTGRLPDFYRRLHRTGRVYVGRPDRGGTPVLAEATGAASAVIPSEPPHAIANLVRSALSGSSGTATIDVEAKKLLAAYEPVAGRELGVVATIEVAEIRAPVIAAAVTGGIATAALVAVSAALVFAIGKPMLARGRQGQTRFRELFNNMRTGAAVLDVVDNGEDFVFRDFNRGAERIEGLERSSVIGRRLTEVFPDVTRAGLLDALRRVGRTGMPEAFPVTCYRDDQRAGWREGYIYRLPSGEIVCLYEDVSERQRAEEALRDSEARWRSIIEMQTVAIVIVDAQRKIRFANRAAEQLFAKSSRDLQGSTFGFPLDEHDGTEIEIARPNQTIAYAELRAMPMRWAGEDQFLLMLRDVSAHRRAEGDLRKLFQGIEQSPVSVVITDIAGNIEYVNPKFTEATGYTYAEVVGKNPRLLKSGQTSAEEYAELWRTITGGKVWRGEFHNKRKNGELFWELAAIAPVRDAHGKITHFVAVKEDVTERRATEERLRRSQRLELVGQLTGGIAHDFNNVLAIILGNLQLLQEKGSGGAEDQELIADALWSAERGAELIHRLLAFARRQRLNPKITDLNLIVSDMTDLLRRTLGEKIEIRERLARGLWSTLIDSGQLENALLNLVVNARDAMPNGGTVTIATSNEVLGSELARKSQEATAGAYVCLAVSDTGVGMPAAVLERIFEPFFTTKKFGQGNGLGLSMVYGFVHQSGGHISVESEIDCGTTVRLYLPKAGVQPAAGAAVPAIASASQPAR